MTFSIKHNQKGFPRSRFWNCSPKTSGRSSIPKFTTGFTLIELLVVISIIGLLSSVVLASLNSARVKGRDAVRMQTLTQYSSALELYRDTTGHYPIGGWFASCWIGSGGNWIADSGNYNWSNGYLPSQPHDPVDTCIWPWDGGNPTASATYAYWSDDGTRYALFARLENASSPYIIQNRPTYWVDGNNLYTVYGWYGRAYGIVVK
jgi:prepilin-type N-terminal cleavage/methylation domain-containing protein